ncbi:MAG: hypothetical protein CM1200mP40_05540 [Gammaproteobacteria bacterium]|nr:MAG: hypothetical protein CM1200mP40_05540 [Gammaproteobacteria bacterium]
MEFDSKGRLWVADRGNHRLELFDQDGNYLESRYPMGVLVAFSSLTMTWSTRLILSLVRQIMLAGGMAFA